MNANVTKSTKMHIVDVDNESTSYLTDNFYDLTEDSYRLPLINTNK